MNQAKPLLLLRASLIITVLLTTAALFQFAHRAYQADLLFVSRRFTAVAVLWGLAIILETLLLVATWTLLGEKLIGALDHAINFILRLGKANILFLIILLAVFAYFSVSPPSQFLKGFYLRLLEYWLVVLASCFLLWGSGLHRSREEIFAASLLITALTYRIAISLPDLSTSPFSLGWSEASRYYYASLYFSRQIYGIQIPPSVLHPTRYLMQAAPFLIPGSPIWLHRLWQVILWIGVTFTTSSLLARRLNISDSLGRWLFILWSFLFLLIGPVYYHLQVVLIIVLLGYDRRRPWKTLITVILASIWAGVSRINWFPVPGMLAATIYLLEVPVNNRAILRYLAKPLFWTIAGTLVAFGSQAAYATLSGNPTELFTSSFSSDLLWYRLLPSPTYPLGILPAALLVSSPLFILIYYRLSKNWRSYHPLRLLGVAAILLVLFAGGLVVSTKIGGGSNLHNMDAYLSLLLVTGAWFYYGKAQPDRLETESTLALQPTARPNWLIMLFVVLVPVYLSLILDTISQPVDSSRVNQALSAINSSARSALEKGGDVLLITERQLLTFDELKDVPLVPDYEKVFLMEMAMANSPSYLGRFYEDLKNHRFGLIISEPLNPRYKTREKSFGEENNAWVKNVVEPLLCYYEPFRTYRELKVQLLKPRSHPGNCTLPFGQ
jgi:hypothetical protein